MADLDLAVLGTPGQIKRGLVVRNREGTESGQTTGGTRRCGMEGCGGVTIGVRWPDGRMTWPCTHGMHQVEPGVYRIGLRP